MPQPEDQQKSASQVPQTEQPQKPNTRVPQTKKPQSPSTRVAQTFLSVNPPNPTDPIQTEPQLQKQHRNLPHWTVEGSCYFITFRLQSGQLSEQERLIVLNHIKAGHQKFYLLAAVVVMPDHVHLLLCPQSSFSLSRIMKGIKGVSARLINQHRGETGTVWQDESWDRIVRNAAEFQEKLQYIADNPVKAGLAAHIDEYPAFLAPGDW